MIKKTTVLLFFVFLAFQQLNTQAKALSFTVSNSTIKLPDGLIQAVAN